MDDYNKLDVVPPAILSDVEQLEWWKRQNQSSHETIKWYEKHVANLNSEIDKQHDLLDRSIQQTKDAIALHEAFYVDSLIRIFLFTFITFFVGMIFTTIMFTH